MNEKDKIQTLNLLKTHFWNCFNPSMQQELVNPSIKCWHSKCIHNTSPKVYPDDSSPLPEKNEDAGTEQIKQSSKVVPFPGLLVAVVWCAECAFSQENVLVLVSPLISISIRSSGKAASGVILGDKIQSWKINQAGNCFVSQKWTFPLLNLLNFVHLQFPIYFKSFAPHTHTQRRWAHRHCC